MADVVRGAVQVLGELLITAGLVILLFCGYELTITGVYTSQEQAVLQGELQQSWSAPRPAVRPTAVALGEGLAVLRAPRLGANYARVVVEGVGIEDLKRGPGHLTRTALPGQLGNTVISGHRTTYGAPFGQVDLLRNGDAVVLETRDSWFTYRVTGQKVVLPDAVEVTLPVPGRPRAKPVQRLLTLTTCHPRFSARQRLIVSAVLSETLSKTRGATPSALRSG